MKKYLLLLLFLPIVGALFFYIFIHTLPKKLQPVDTQTSMRLLFLGDIMGHQAQINAAYDTTSQSYNYDTVFAQVSSLIKSYDFTVANLEVTLSGEPYSGYPSFSSPDALVKAIKKSGIDVLMTANNHACDKGGKGLKRTIKVLDEYHMMHTGTFAKDRDRNKTNMIVLNKNDIRVGLLNYTEHTNWMPTPKGTFVNRIDLPLMLSDIHAAKDKQLDTLIVMLHWGKEYKFLPRHMHTVLAQKLFDAGVDIIIGAHPHTLQPMHYTASTKQHKERLIYYSLGNFVSDQRRRYTNGGALAGLVLAKHDGKTYIKEAGYHLVWVHKQRDANKTHYEVIPVAAYESNRSSLKGLAQKRMEEFISDSRKHLYKHNQNIIEW